MATFRIKDNGAISEWVKETFPYGHNRTVHIHLIDYGDSVTENDRRHRQLTEITVNNLSKDLQDLSQSTDGVILSCSAPKNMEDVVCKVLEKLWTDEKIHDFKPENRRSLICALCDAKQKPQTDYVHSVLQMDDKIWPANNKMQFRLAEEIRTTFISEMTKLPQNSLLQTEDEATPVVCVLMDSGERSLSAALMAVRRDIPVIVMKGGDPGLDYLASHHQQMKLTWERRHVGKEIQHTAVPKFDQSLTFTDLMNRMSDKAKGLMKNLIKHLHLIAIYNADALNNEDLNIRGDVHVNDLNAENVNDLNDTILPALGRQNLEPLIGLDSVILEALIINKKEKEVAVFLKSLCQNEDIASEQSFIKDKSIQWDIFIRSLQNGAASSVKAFLGDIQVDCDYFHFGKVLQLYNYKHGSFIRTGKSIEELQGVTDELVKKFYKARRDLKKYVGVPGGSSLRCTGLGCPHCTFTLEDLTDTNVRKTAKEMSWQTCLHPVQELFLWSLLYSNSDVTTALWVYTKDRMASALFASAVYYGIAQTVKTDNKMGTLDTYTQLIKDSLLFKKLAIDTLAACTSLSEHKTDILLRKACPWWNRLPARRGTDRQSCCHDWWCGRQPRELTVLDMAIQTKCKAFIAKEMCDQILSRRWTETKKDTTLPKLPKETGKWKDEEEKTYKCCKRKDTNTPKSCMCSKCCTSPHAIFLSTPKAHFVACNLGQLGFLILYSYVLLMNLNGTWDPSNIALIIWVCDISVVEMRQLLSVEVSVETKPTACGGPVRKAFYVLKKKSVSYISEDWNILDAIGIIGFIVGSALAFLPEDTSAHSAGCLFLSADIVIVIFRLLQVFMYFKELGLWLVMATKMAWDTARFMFILLSTAYAYAVSSESLMHTRKAWPDLYKVAQKAFFSMFGDFSLDDIEKTQDSRTWKWVPVYLGIFVVMTNVLLLNLLIARLSSRYVQVEAKAIEYRAWMKYKVFREMQNRSRFPPPFNILVALFAPLAQCCFRRKREMTPARGRRTGSSSQRAPNTSGHSGTNDVLEMQNTAAGWKLELQMHGTCLSIWNERISGDTGISVVTKTTMDSTTKINSFMLHKNRHRLIWKSDPAEVVEIKIKEHNCSDQEFQIYPPSPLSEGEEPNYSNQESVPLTNSERTEVVNNIDKDLEEIYIQYAQLDEFEKEQAEWAIQQIGLEDSAQ